MNTHCFNGGWNPWVDGCFNIFCFIFTCLGDDDRKFTSGDDGYRSRFC